MLQKNLKKKFQLKLKNATSTKFNFGDNYDIYFLPHPLKKNTKNKKLARKGPKSDKFHDTF